MPQNPESPAEPAGRELEPRQLAAEVRPPPHSSPREGPDPKSPSACAARAESATSPFQRTLPGLPRPLRTTDLPNLSESRRCEKEPELPRALSAQWPAFRATRTVRTALARHPGDRACNRFHLHPRRSKSAAGDDASTSGDGSKPAGPKCDTATSSANSHAGIRGFREKRGEKPLG